MGPLQSKPSVLQNVVIWEGDLSMMDLSVFQHVEQLVRYFYLIGKGVLTE